MSIGLIGRKCGMTRIFTEAGASISITVVEVLPNRITQVKTIHTDGYNAFQVTVGRQLSARINRPLAGHYAKAAVEAGKVLREFRLEDHELIQVKVANELKVDIFKEGQVVDVRGLTRGKGFSGTVKRHNFRTQDTTHGNSLSHRAPGSIGQCQTPGRVWKGKKMAGQLGNIYCTVQSQEIIKVDVIRNLLLIKGALPGAPGGEVVVTPSSKKYKGRK